METSELVLMGTVVLNLWSLIISSCYWWRCEPMKLFQQVFFFKPLPGSFGSLWPDTLTETLQAFHLTVPKNFLIASWYLLEYVEWLSKLTWRLVGLSIEPTNLLLSFNADFNKEKQLLDLQISGYFTYWGWPLLNWGLPQFEYPMC